MAIRPRSSRVVRGPRDGRGAWLAIAALHLSLGAGTALAQGSPVKLDLQGSPSRTETGALRCAVGDETEFGLTGTDSAGQTVINERYVPEVKSTDERVLVAALSPNSPYVMNTVCKGDGEAWILVRSGKATMEYPVLVGRARSRATPRTRVARGPATTAPKGTASRGTRVTASAAARTSAEMPAKSGARPQAGVVHSTGASQSSADPAAVPAKGLILYAGYDNVQLTWRAAPGAVGYRVARKDVAANTLVTLTGESVAADGTGLVRDTTYFDGSAVAGRQYVYYLATYFRRSNGDYYFPAPDAEARGVATPRSSAGLPWLPADWKTRPAPRSAAVIAGPAFDVRWHGKQRATGYIYFTYIGTREDPGVRCDGWAYSIVALSAPLPGHSQVTMDSSLVKGVPGMVDVDPPLPGETRRGGSKDAFGREKLPATMYCVAVYAVYPDAVDASGTPVVTRYDGAAGAVHGNNAEDGIASRPLFFAIRRTCPSGMSEDNCTAWQVVPTNDLPQNAP